MICSAHIHTRAYIYIYRYIFFYFFLDPKKNPQLHIFLCPSRLLGAFEAMTCHEMQLSLRPSRDSSLGSSEELLPPLKRWLILSLSGLRCIGVPYVICFRITFYRRPVPSDRHRRGVSKSETAHGAKTRAKRATSCHVT